MNQKYSSVLALELAMYEVHNVGYDPIGKIIDFWAKYDIYTIQKTMDMLLKKSANPLSNENVLELCRKQVFAVELMAVIIAYFHVHYNGLDISRINISDAEITQCSLNDLEITKRIHEFFGRIAD